MSDAKVKQLDQFRVNMEKDSLQTTNFGTKIEHTDDSLKAGARGPTLLEDFHHREKISSFDHERIPERVVHARGAAAHGYFQSYGSCADITKAAVFNDTSRKTPVFVRFSTVLGSRGAADTARDVRGFAVRFYTPEGHWDLVGNNIPVFFIQDAIKFPDLIHSGKPHPHNEIPGAATAHDNFWDFISLMPESAHMVTWILSDRTIPRSYRMMEGFGVHSFILVDEKGARRFVKFHWKPVLGVHSLCWDESQKLSGQDPDFHRRDLYEAIESGNYPEWELCFQVVEEKDEHSFDFDLLDSTKIIPEELVPLRKVGKMVLNSNPTDYFAETEQVAFCTQHVVPGIDFSNDPLLQGRNFSYQDTQLTRLGGPNFMEIPINRPICPVFNHQRDGYGRSKIGTGTINYFPNRLGGAPRPASEAEGGYKSTPATVEGVKERARGPKFQERFNQATLFYNSLTKEEKDHLHDAACFELSKVEEEEVQKAMLDMFNRIEPTIAGKVADALGLPHPAPIPGWKNHGKSSAHLSQARTVDGSIATRKIAIIVADGFDGQQVKEIMGALSGAGAIPAVVGAHKGDMTSASGDKVRAQFTLFSSKSTMFDAVIVPDGAQHIAALTKNGNAIAFITEAFKHYKAIGALGGAIDLLKTKCVLPGVSFAVKGGSEVNSLGVVTGEKVLGSLAGAASNVVGGTMAGAAAGAIGAGGFMGQFIQAVGMHRSWGRDVSSVPA